MTIGLLALILVLVFAAVSIYNGLIKRNNYVDQAFSGMDAALKKRHDLLPNLIEMVKVHMTHEKELLVKVTDLNSKTLNPDLSVNEKVATENKLSQAMRVIVLALESNPNIKTKSNFMQIQNTMNDVEFEISGARKAYNSRVVEFNNALELFPTNLIAKTMGLARRLFLEIPDAERAH
jgi:LemA protein